MKRRFNKIPVILCLQSRTKNLSPIVKRSFLIVLFLCSIHAFSQDAFPIQDGTIMVLPDVENGKTRISIEDEYTSVMSKFDLQSKTMRKDIATVADYLTNAVNNVKEWNNDDKAMFKKMAESISAKIKSTGINIKMPDTIFVIKTTMKEEGGAEGYTRGKCIFLKESLFGGRGDDVQNILIHEMFHVISRNDHGLREKVYNTIGFKKCNEVPYPREIASLRLSNPDAPHNNFYLTVQLDGKPIDVMLILYASKDYDGGSFFNYLRVGLLVVSGSDTAKGPVYQDEKLLINDINSVKNFYEQVGRNTGYVIHAEEICADQFVMLLNQNNDIPNPELIEAMKKVMTSN